jgi:hypothetical protein
MKREPTISRHCRWLAAAAFVLSATGTPAQFTPGEGGSIPGMTPLQGIPGQIAGLKVAQTHRRKNIFSTGTHAEIDLSFPPPSTHEAAGYTLQKSVDGNIWDTQFTTSSTSQDNFSFTPEGALLYRLLVNGGPKAGQVSNRVSAPVSSVDTRFAGWSLDESMFITGTMAPWVGRGLQASFDVRKLEDDSLVTDGLSYQWYRINPLSSEMTLIDGATSLTYVTTEADVGGYDLLCKATGDGVNVGGFCQIGSGWETVIPNKAFASGITDSGFRLNLFKSVPSLAAGDLEISYYNGSQNVILPVTGITAQPGNALFDIAVALPADATDVWVNNHSDVWLLASEMFPGHVMQGLRITLRTPFDLWVFENPGIPAERRGMLDHNGPLDLQNLMAYAMGLDPLTATPDDLPHVHSPDTAAGTLHLVYRRSRTHYDAWLTPMISGNLTDWSPANMLSYETVLDGGDWEKIDALISLPPGNQGFIKLEATYSSW